MKQQFFPQRLFMDMKRLIINRLVGLGLLAVGILVSCSAPTAFVPVPSPNPWADDYTALSSMENYKQWGTYNVHDPACKKIGDTYYLYSTDAIFAENRKEAKEKNVPLGFVQVRKSKDLVHWDFVGWAFPEIPAPAIEWVHSQAEGKGATNIWAPYLMPYQGIYRLYYCVSAFGRNTSYIGMAESDSPEGPWIQKGCVVKTGEGDAMNASGPGSFTGLRIGAATAKGLGGALSIPLIAVPTLEGLAYNLVGAEALVCPIMDARRQQAYYGIYDVSNEVPVEIEKPDAAPIEVVLQKAKETKREVIFLGEIGRAHV